jgi:hypothetical protein
MSHEHELPEWFRGFRLDDATPQLDSLVRGWFTEVVDARAGLPSERPDNVKLEFHAQDDGGFELMAKFVFPPRREGESAWVEWRAARFAESALPPSVAARFAKTSRESFSGFTFLWQPPSPP